MLVLDCIQPLIVMTTQKNCIVNVNNVQVHFKIQKFNSDKNNQLALSAATYSNRKLGVWDSKYVVILYPPHTSHTAARMRIVNSPLKPTTSIRFDLTAIILGTVTCGGELVFMVSHAHILTMF